MTPQQAKEILLLYRPGTADAEDPDVAEAIGLTRDNAELAKWFEEHCLFQSAIRSSLRSMEVPAPLEARTLSRRQVVPLPVTMRPAVWLAVAAMLVLLCLVAGVLLRPAAPNAFAQFQARVVGTAVRDYRMDITTNDMEVVRSFLAAQGAPGDYELTKGLERLGLTGAGALRWRNNPVSMVCFNRGDNEMLFLFVVQKSALKNPPPLQPELVREKGKICARWSKGEKAYVLAGPEEADFARKYL